jgi:hypothetical protein
MYIGNAHGDCFGARRSPRGARVHRTSPSRSVVCQTTSDNAKGSTCGVESYYEYDMYNII